ncbi:hypothetical protein D922_01605 [Enterococcus faecalis 06-MB-DW-09]|nr:hypothetical protein D922_01605 [Enterococcus faecalis 06-MB-DW-09]
MDSRASGLKSFIEKNIFCSLWRLFGKKKLQAFLFQQNDLRNHQY